MPSHLIFQAIQKTEVFMTFKELIQTGQCSISAIDAWVEIWRKEKGIRQSLQAFLGLNDTEYQIWLMQGNAGLARQFSDGRSLEYETVYLGWDELTAQLQEIVDAELGAGCTVTLRRQDYYYWDMRLETVQEMDEALSEKICERLELRDVEVLMFLEEDWVDSGYLCGILSQETAISGSFQQNLASVCNGVSVWRLIMGWIPRYGSL